jgi:hypothetical protein
MEFQIKCHLGYEVSGPASFLFNVSVARNSFQRIITEHFDVGGAEYCQEIAIGGQRYHRVTAQGGPVELVYDAVVDATHEVLGDPSRLQVPLLNKFQLKPWFSFTRAVSVSLTYSPDSRNGSSTKTSLGSIELRGYVIGFPNELNICPEQLLQRRRPSIRLRN